MEKKKIYFDVINSVKGGSGKSTVSLLLAACLQHYGASAYIVDLDLHGSSWCSNFFGGSSGNLGPDVVSVNDWMKNPAYSDKKSSFANVKMQISELANKEYTIPVAIINPFMIDVVDEVETDLFERAISQIVDKIISVEASNGSRPVHIVMDMPPSNEVHAERILNQLLLDAESPLVQKFADSKGDYANYSPYVIQLIMLSPLSKAHLDLNMRYITKFAKAKTFSSLLDEFVRTKRFHLMFWGNDVVGVMTPDMNENTIEVIETNFQVQLQWGQNEGAKVIAPSAEFVGKIIPYEPISIRHSETIKHDIIKITKAIGAQTPFSNSDLESLLSAVQDWKKNG